MASIPIKTTVKYLINLVVFLSVLSLLSSCMRDEENNTVSFWGIVEVVEGESYDYKVLLDDGVVLIPETSDASYTGRNGDRVKVYFELKPGFIEGDKIIHVNVNYILVYDIKSVKTFTEGSDFGNDPIGVIEKQVWQSNNLLNINFAIDVGYDYVKAHNVNLVYYPDSSATVKGGVFLQLHHNANNDADEMVVDDFLSFDMESIKPFLNAQDSVPYTIVINKGAFTGAVSRLEGYYYNPNTK